MFFCFFPEVFILSQVNLSYFIQGLLGYSANACTVNRMRSPFPAIPMSSNHETQESSCLFRTETCMIPAKVLWHVNTREKDHTYIYIYGIYGRFDEPQSLRHIEPFAVASGVFAGFFA